MRNTYGGNYLVQFAAQGPKIQGSASASLNQVAAGAAAIYAPAPINVVLSLIDQGAPIAFAETETATATRQVIGISSKAPHPNVAKLFLNYYLSPEGQGVFVGAGQLSAIPTITGQKYATPKNLISGHEVEASQSHNEFVKILNP